jgi:hypothetical protein
MRIHNG